MARLIYLAAAAVALLFVAGIGVTLIGELRLVQRRAECQEHQRELWMALLVDGTEPGRADRLRPELPAATVGPKDLAPELRLSWAVDAVPRLATPAAPLAGLLDAADRNLAWDAGPNAPLGQSPVKTLLCPNNLPGPLPGGWQPTLYVGVTGVDPDAAALGLGPPVPLRAGAFRSDAPTPLSAFRDGLSQTILQAEVSRDLGAWTRGGPATARGLLVGADAPPPVGPAGQFGGNHFGGANFGFADGSARFLTDRTSPVVLQNLVTLAGAGAPGGDPLPGEP